MRECPLHIIKVFSEIYKMLVDRVCTAMVRAAALVSGDGVELQAILDSMYFKEIPDFELVILAGYDRPLGVIPYQFKNRIIGTYNALYPAFEDEEGDIQRAVIERGVKITGATAYFADSDGRVGNIILQKAIEVRPDDTPDTLRSRVLEEGVWKILSEAVTLYCERRLSIRGSRVVIGKAGK